MSDEHPAQPRPRSLRRSLLALGSVASLLVVCGAVITVSWISGAGAGERQADSEFRQAEQVEKNWHLAHPDPTAPVLPDYSGYLGKVAKKMATS